MSNDSGNSKIEVTGEENTSKEAKEKKIKEISDMLRQVTALDEDSKLQARKDINKLMDDIFNMNNPSK